MDAMAQVLLERGYRLSEVLTRLQAFGAPTELFARLAGSQALANQPDETD
jgi:hypothetical protein